VNVHAKSCLILETSAGTPVRDQGPGGSQPGPDAGHPLHDGWRSRRLTIRTRARGAPQSGAAPTRAERFSLPVRATSNELDPHDGPEQAITQQLDPVAVGPGEAVECFSAIPALIRAARPVNVPPDRSLPRAYCRIIAAPQHIHPRERPLGEGRPELPGKVFSYRLTHGASPVAHLLKLQLPGNLSSHHDIYAGPARLDRKARMHASFCPCGLGATLGATRMNNLRMSRIRLDNPGRRPRGHGLI